MGDFGLQGSFPTHPELLDWLALRFVESKWDVKQTLRLMLTSQTYRQASNDTRRHAAVDPQNKWLWRAPRVRLQAETVRDNALSAAGLLSLKMGGRLVTCGSTSGVSAETNLMMVFQRQLRIFGSFGASMRNIADGYAKMARGILPVLDTVVPLDRFAEGLERLESRRVFGKIVVTL